MNDLDFFYQEEEYLNKQRKDNTMQEKQIALKILLHNYRNGNKWLSNLDIQGGYEIEENGKTHIYYTNLSRRISDIKFRLHNGKEFYVLKDNHHNGTKYTAYRLPNLTSIDIKLIERYIANSQSFTVSRKRKSDFKLKKKEVKKSWFDKLVDYIV